MSEKKRQGWLVVRDANERQVAPPVKVTYRQFGGFLLPLADGPISLDIPGANGKPVNVAGVELLNQFGESLWTWSLPERRLMPGEQLVFHAQRSFDDLRPNPVYEAWV